MTVVRAFHESFDLPRPEGPTFPTDELARLRLRLIREEYEEVRTEFEALIRTPTVEGKLGALRRLLKELADLRYVTEGAAVSFGLDIEGAYEEVHRSNMSKLGEDGKPIHRQDGKVLKGPNYTEADMEKFVPPIIEGSVSCDSTTET